MQVTSADSSRMREIAGVGTVELVYLGGLLKVGGDSFLLPMWRSAGGEFSDKRESDVQVVRQIAYG